MPWWRVGTPSPVLFAAGVFLLLGREGQAQTFHVTYYKGTGCTGDILTKTNQVLGTCDNLATPPHDDGLSRGYTILCAKDSWAHASYAATSLLVNIDNANCGVSAQGATLNYQMPLQKVCWQAQNDRSVWLKWEYPANGAALCGETLPVAPTPSVQGDPVTWHGNVREEFILPPGTLSPLLKSPDMQVLASSRPGHAEDEWIDRVVITSAAGEHIVDVSIKRDLTYFDRAELPPNSFETLDVKMEWSYPNGGMVNIMPPGDAQFNHWSGISLGFGRVRHFGQLKAGTAPRREAVYVVSNSLKILILSSSAREYFLEKGEHLSMEHSHLDLELMELGDQSNLTGILPELWGILPMSEETRKLRKLSKDDDTVDDRPRTVSLPLIVESSAASEIVGNCTADSPDSCQAGQGTPVPVASVEGFSGEGTVHHKDRAAEVESLSAAL